MWGAEVEGMTTAVGRVVGKEVRAAEAVTVVV